MPNDQLERIDALFPKKKEETTATSGTPSRAQELLDAIQARDKKVLEEAAREAGVPYPPQKTQPVPATPEAPQIGMSTTTESSTPSDQSPVPIIHKKASGKIVEGLQALQSKVVTSPKNPVKPR